VTAGRHRSPPPDARPDWRWRTLAALAGLGILAPPVWLAAAAVAPDARGAGLHGTTVSTTARATREVLTSGPLAIPTVDVTAPTVEPPLETVTAQSPVTVHRVPVRTQRPTTTTKAVSETLATPESTPEQTVTPDIQTVTEEPAAESTSDAPPPTTAAASTSSATPTPEEPAVTETPTPTPDVPADVTAEVTGP
jgi:hypothetical protein